MTNSGTREKASPPAPSKGKSSSSATRTRDDADGSVVGAGASARERARVLFGTCTDAIDCPQACAAGDEAACTLFAESVEALGPDAHKLTSASAWLRACEQNDRAACTRVAALLDERNEAPLARALAERGARKLTQICGAGDDDACGEALAVAEAWSFDSLARATMTRLMSRCDDGSAAACLEALANGESTALAGELEMRIISLVRAQCLTGAETECLTMKSLADLRRREDAADEAARKVKLAATPAMREKTEGLATKCDAREASACVELATLYVLHGMPVTARVTMSGACDLEAPRADVCFPAFLLQRDFSTAGKSLDELEPWKKLRAACKGGSAEACKLAKHAERVVDAGNVDTELVARVARAPLKPFGVAPLTIAPGTGDPSMELDRVLAVVSWHATNGDPLFRTTSLELVSLNRGDALAEVLRGRAVGEKAIARISPGPLSQFAVPVVVTTELLAFVPRALR